MHAAAGMIDVATAATVAQHPDARIAIAGVSGAGKTTLAQTMSRMLGLPYTELDSLHWGANWTPRPEFIDDARALIDGPTWITELQYRAVRPLILERSTLLIWLDPPSFVSVSRVVRRTAQKRRTREVLWNGNLQPSMVHAFLHRDGIVRWAISTRSKMRAAMPGIAESHPDLPIVRMRTRAEVEQLLALLPSPGHRL